MNPFSKKFFLALSTLIGMIVGAGIFALPYASSKSGLGLAIFYLFLLGGAALLLHLFFGEIILRTRKKHRLSGYARKYLGRPAEILITVSMVLGIGGALLAYIILAGQFLKVIFAAFFTLPAFYFTLLFWAVLFYFVFRGRKMIARAELLMNIFLFLVILIIFLFALPKFALDNFTLLNTSALFLPYGVFLFAFAGWAALPSVADILSDKGKVGEVGLPPPSGSASGLYQYKKVIIWASILVFFLYLLFITAVLGVSGAKTSEDALSGLVPFLGQKIIFLGALLGTISVASSFLILANYFKNTLYYDYNFPKPVGASIACFLPLILFVLGVRSFVSTLSVVGTLIGVLEGVIIILIFKKIKKAGDREPEYSLKIPTVLLYFLIAVFILGAVAQLL